MNRCHRMMSIVVAGASFLGAAAQPATAPADGAARLREAARRGSAGAIEELIRTGVDINAADDRERTAIHYAAEGGHVATVELLLKAGADAGRADREGRTPLDLARKNGHDGTASVLAAALGNRLERGARPALNPALKYPDLAAFERAIGAPAMLLKSEHVWFFAAKTYESEAKVVFPILTKAYAELRTITGLDTDYIIVVYNFPKGHPDARGGTSNCTIWYDDSNLRLNEQDEWKRHGKPHVSGYIEEMAHNFVAATKAQFGWEMIGWSISATVCARVAGNPIQARAVQQTRQGQLETLQRYRAQSFTFPADLPANQVDRIHAALLWQCEQRYGQRFWNDFFKEIATHRGELEAAAGLVEPDAIRNERYRITVACFDKLPRLSFRQLLEDNGISMTVDVKSLHPTEPGWNRRLR